MALDFILVDEKKGESQFLPLGTETHSELLEVAKKHSCKLFLRVEDYYQDAAFKHDELKDLLAEVESLLNVLRDNKYAFEFLSKFKQMIEEGIHSASSIRVRSD
jgi:hypothetical protein